MKAIVLAVAITTLPAAAAAQAWTPPTAGADAHRFQADQHRQALERQRQQADQREAFARQIETETRLRRLTIEAARQPAPPEPSVTTGDISLEEQRRRREAATARRQAVVTGAGQIDTWLDRRPD